MATLNEEDIEEFKKFEQEVLNNKIEEEKKEKKRIDIENIIKNIEQNQDNPNKENEDKKQENIEQKYEENKDQEKQEEKIEQETEIEQQKVPVKKTKKLTSKQQEVLDFRQNLPITQFKEEIINLVAQNNFVVLTGDTGSGKSTQLPQYVYDSEKIQQAVFGVLDEVNEQLPQVQIIKEEEQTGELQQNLQLESKKEKNQINKKRQLNVVTTQPRRVAAISMAKRMCYEREAILGEEVGYTIRFDDTSSEKTRLKFVTDGILVRECLNDRDLSKYNVVILDEAHERSLSTDVLFALVKQAVLRRNGSLKLIVTSATLNTDQFSQYFNKCPVLKMKGRSFPVEIKHTISPGGKRVDECVKSAIRFHLHEGPGDILIFLTGKEECEVGRRLCIQKLQELVQQRQVAKALIYTLYGSQHQDDQQQVFQKAPENTRKIIFSTNIAETSLTIDGIGFVIDCGYVKEKCYNSRTGMDALIAVPISKVQAIQRTGRAGRTQEGKCFRLYSDQFYKDQMKEQSKPEILRVNLANVILGLKNMNINDVLGFDFMEKPDNDTILQALKQLYLLDAIDEKGNITELGKQMCRFPLEPSYAKSLITSIIFNVEEKMITLVSLLSSEQIWSKPPRVKEQEYAEFEQKMMQFQDLDGDHETLIKIRKNWVKTGYSEQFCRQNFLNSRALKQAENIRVQLEELIRGTDISLCKQYYKEDPLYKLFKKSEQLNKEKQSKHSKSHRKDKIEDGMLTSSQIFRMAITNGFYFNTARKVANSDEHYILVFTESGNMVEMEPSSVYVLTEHFPQCVVYTELGGLSLAKGVIRLLSEIDYDWVKPYKDKYNKVDVFQLAGMQQDNKRLLMQQRREEKEKEEKKNEKSKDQKKQEALLKYQQRKKIKTNNQK